MHAMLSGMITGVRRGGGGGGGGGVDFWQNSGKFGQTWKKLGRSTELYSSCMQWAEVR